jgi:hypothetical protein
MKRKGREAARNALNSSEIIIKKTKKKKEKKVIVHITAHLIELNSLTSN